ncbi:MAG: hypothetical protein KZQ58_12745 [gamma proteobacterium symbiont of Bathyaustriella thionipta]|nr:hypothetical protein [gamma proteobacterium symbiont of Bathyaustriella thionipta]
MKTYLVGGAVRDELLGLPVRERDWVVTGATEQSLLQQGFRYKKAGFPVFLHPETGEEYALARRERKTATGYKGFAFETGPDVSLQEDLARRDLSINAIAKTVQGELIDPWGGQQDLAAGILRHITPAFREDPLRLLRAARFAARFEHLGFRLKHTTFHVMQDMVADGELASLGYGRFWRETLLAAASHSPQKYFQILCACGALGIFLPQAARFICPKNAHSKQAQEALQRLQHFSTQHSQVFLRLAVLLCETRLPAEHQPPKQIGDWQQAMQLVANALPLLRRFDAATGVHLLQQLKAWQRKDYFLTLLDAMRACYSGDKAVFTWLENSFERAAKVSLNDSELQHIQGAERGKRLFEKRVQVIQENT